jgi:hypothetical protein
MTSAINTTGLATQYDWIVQVDALVKLQIPVVDANGVPFNVTGWVVDAEVKTGSGGAVLYTWDSGNIAASGTSVVLTIKPSTSNAWTFDSGYWRCVVQNPLDSTQRYRLAEGHFLLSAD